MFCGYSSRCRGLVCSVWLWNFLIILTCFFVIKVHDVLITKTIFFEQIVCHGFVCSLGLLYFLIILIYYFWSDIYYCSISSNVYLLIHANVEVQLQSHCVFCYISNNGILLYDPLKRKSSSENYFRVTRWKTYNMFIKRLCFRSKECTGELKLECASFPGQTS